MDINMNIKEAKKDITLRERKKYLTRNDKDISLFIRGTEKMRIEFKNNERIYICDNGKGSWGVTTKERFIKVLEKYKNECLNSFNNSLKEQYEKIVETMDNKLIELKENVINRISEEFEIAVTKSKNKNLSREERLYSQEKVNNFRYFMGIIEQEIEYLNK